MKKKTCQYIIGLLVLPLFTACDFEKINTNEFEMLPEEGLMDGIAIGGPITAMEKCVVPVGTQADGTSVVNRYQTAYNLAADCWSGYFGQNNNWGGPNNLNYFLRDGWVASSYTEAYSTYHCGRMSRARPRQPILRLSPWRRSSKYRLGTKRPICSVPFLTKKPARD